MYYMKYKTRARVVIVEYGINEYTLTLIVLLSCIIYPQYLEIAHFVMCIYFGFNN